MVASRALGYGLRSTLWAAPTFLVGTIWSLAIAIVAGFLAGAVSLFLDLAREIPRFGTSADLGLDRFEWIARERPNRA